MQVWRKLIPDMITYEMDSILFINLHQFQAEPRQHRQKLQLPETSPLSFFSKVCWINILHYEFKHLKLNAVTCFNHISTLTLLSRFWFRTKKKRFWFRLILHLIYIWIIFISCVSFCCAYINRINTQLINTAYWKTRRIDINVFIRH